MKRDIIKITGKEISITGQDVWMSAAEIAGLFNGGELPQGDTVRTKADNPEKLPAFVLIASFCFQQYISFLKCRMIACCSFLLSVALRTSHLRNRFV
mgnify:CR=1 FL=1